MVKLSEHKLNSAVDSKDVALYFNGGDFDTMEFKKEGELIFFTTEVDSWSIVAKRGEYVWRFDSRRQILRLYFNKKLFSSFRPIYQRQAQLESEYADRPPTATVELAMKRVL